VALGAAFGTFLLDNNQVLAELANHTIQVPFPFISPNSAKNGFKSLLFHLPRNALYWLDAWPAGLKLNTELSRFYAKTFIGVIDTWECEYLILPVFLVMSHPCPCLPQPFCHP
jgi:phosphatidylinositol N-acetylglucosaminyltransferase subunit Q